mmetsp:Transcript_79495/g.221039  ORF Transcript_79495/g.221039 Transcript_79495/m.221039 type:complete len:133 (+) Transcript_79495:48-446(+)
MAAEMPAAGAGAGGAGGGMPGGMAGAPPSREEMEAKRAEQEEQRRLMLLSILEPAARERLSRVAIVKPDKARAIEDRLIQMARGGAFHGKIDEGKLTQMLEGIAESSSAATKITFKRRGADSDEEEDDDSWM